MVRLPPLDAIHHYRHRRNDTNSRQNPRNNLDDLQLVALSQTILEAALNGADALVADDGAPHLVDQDAGDDPEDG